MLLPLLFFLKSDKNMSGKLEEFIKKWEGGLSRDPHDTASSNPAPWEYQGKKGWHTNKGITFTTFQTYASKLGYAVTPQLWFTMPNELWQRILWKAYAGGYPLEKINHLPRIQAVIITWAWGSGLAGSEFRLARFQREVMGIKDSNITKSEIVENFAKKITPANEKHWFNLLCDRRAEDFKKMSSFDKHGKGWLNRLADFRKTFA